MRLFYRFAILPGKPHRLKGLQTSPIFCMLRIFSVWIKHFNFISVLVARFGERIFLKIFEYLMANVLFFMIVLSFRHTVFAKEEIYINRTYRHSFFKYFLYLTCFSDTPSPLYMFSKLYYWTEFWPISRRAFLRCLRDPSPRVEIRVPRNREIGSLQAHTGYPTFSLKKLISRKAENRH